MELKYCFTEQEYIDFALRVTKKRRQKILAVSFVCLAVFFAILLISTRAPIEVTVLFILILLLFVLVIPFLQRIIITRLTKTQIKKLGNDFFTSEKRIELTDNELISESSLVASKISYGNIVKTYQDDRFAYIEIKGGNKIFIPLSTPGLVQFLDSLKQKIEVERG